MNDKISASAEAAFLAARSQHDVLWTGGWDSSFRVLYLALVEKASIQPHYVIDVARQSSLRELQAIADIRRELALLDPDAATRIRPLQISSILDIPADAPITASYERLRARSWLGGQYDWLARYAKSRQLSRLELSIHVDDKAYGFLKGHVTRGDDGWRYSDELTKSDDPDGNLRIFAAFRFPLLDYTKLRMRETAEQHGFLPILEKAWFCYQPTHGKPCGLCNPCIYTIQEGMSYRFPRSALIRYRLRHAHKALDLSRRASRKAIRLLTGGRVASAKPATKQND